MVILYYDENGYNHCGSNYTLIFKDLKTVKGALNRIKRYDIKAPKNAVKMIIMPFNSWYYNNVHFLENALKYVLHIKEI